MKTVNSISGGKTSAYIAAHYSADYNIFSLVCIDDRACAPKDTAIVRYVNEKLANFSDRYGAFIATAEDDKTIVAMMELEQFLGKDIIWVRGHSFDNIIDGDWSGVFGGSTNKLPNKHFRYCTQEMKLLPIFEWWFMNIGEKINMRIGFRHDEYDRMERFLNNGQANSLRIPVTCSTRGKRRQKKETFNWRYCSFPLVKSSVTKEMVNDFWKNKPVHFPEISNCVHCFWKKADTLSIMAALHPEKMNWAAQQETKGKGTWLPSGIEYRAIIENSRHWIPEMLKENGASCDSGGCHD